MMMWLVPTFQDMRCIFAFIVLSAVSFLCGHFLVMERPPDAKEERMQASILIYGSVQSFIGLVGGFYISKLLYGHSPAPGGYGYVRSDENVMEI